MVEQQEIQQQDHLDEELVPVNDQVRIGLSNFRIALEKQQPYVIYKLCLEILRQYSFFKAFTGTDDMTSDFKWVHKESKEGTLDHLKKLKGIETLSSAAQYLVDMKKSQKQARKNFHPQTMSLKFQVEGSSIMYRYLDKALRKAKDAKDVDDQAREEQAMDEQAGIEQHGKVQNEVSVPEPQVEKPSVQLLSSSLKLSSAEYGNQFINDNPDVLLTDVLKDPTDIKIQSMVDVLVHQRSLEAIAKGELDPIKTLRKRHHDDDQDPHVDSKEKKKKKRRRKDFEPSKKDQRFKIVQDAAMDAEESIKDDVVDAEDPTNDDAALNQDRFKWFNQDDVVRPETPDPEWSKEPNA
ncbi:hypothetical protein Tco_0073299 [Tanacetum coccineum]